MYADRLLKVAEILERPQLPPKIGKFDMSVWFHEDDCGTSACAFGCAAFDPFFQDLGVKLEILKEENGDTFRSMPYYDGYENIEAIMVLFDISRFAAHHLFLKITNNGLSRLQVAAKIRQFVQDNSKNVLVTIEEYRRENPGAVEAAEAELIAEGQLGELVGV